MSFCVSTPGFTALKTVLIDRTKDMPKRGRKRMFKRKEKSIQAPILKKSWGGMSLAWRWLARSQT